MITYTLDSGQLVPSEHFICLCGPSTQSNLAGRQTCCDIQVNAGPASIIAVTSTTITYQFSLEVVIDDLTCTARTIRATSTAFGVRTFGAGLNYINATLPISGGSIDILLENLCSEVSQVIGISLPPVPCCPYNVVLGTPIDVGASGTNFIYQVPVSFNLNETVGCYLNYPTLSSVVSSPTIISGDTLITAIVPLAGGNYVFTITGACGVNEIILVDFPVKTCCDWNVTSTSSIEVDGTDLDVTTTFTLTETQGGCVESTFLLESSYFPDTVLTSGVPVDIEYTVDISEAGTVYATTITSSCSGEVRAFNVAIPTAGCCRWAASVDELDIVYNDPVYEIPILIQTTTGCINDDFEVTVDGNSPVLVPANVLTVVNATLPTTGGTVSITVESVCDSTVQLINVDYPADPPCCSFSTAIVDGPTPTGVSGSNDTFDIEIEIIESGCTPDVNTYSVSYKPSGGGYVPLGTFVASDLVALTIPIERPTGSTSPWTLRVLNLCDNTQVDLDFNYSTPPCCNYQLSLTPYPGGSFVRIVTAASPSSTYEITPVFSFQGPMGCTEPEVFVESQYFALTAAASGVPIQFTAPNPIGGELDLEWYFCTGTPDLRTVDMPEVCCAFNVTYDSLVKTGTNGAFDIYSIRFIVTPVVPGACGSNSTITFSGFNSAYGPRVENYNGAPIQFTDTFSVLNTITEATFRVINTYCSEELLSVTLTPPPCCTTNLDILGIIPTGKVNTLGEHEFELYIGVTGNFGPLPCNVNTNLRVSSPFWVGETPVNIGSNIIRFFAPFGATEDVTLLGSCISGPLEIESASTPAGYESCCTLKPPLPIGLPFTTTNVGPNTFEFVVLQEKQTNVPTFACNTYGYELEAGPNSWAITNITPNIISEATIETVQFDVDYNAVFPTPPLPGETFFLRIRAWNRCRTFFIDYTMQITRPV